VFAILAADDLLNRDECWFTAASGNPQETEPKLNLDVVSRQLKQMGVMETIQLRQVGYSSRIPFDEFLRRYQSISEVSW
jgi:myosin heavy subunit